MARGRTRRAAYPVCGESYKVSLASPQPLPRYLSRVRQRFQVPYTLRQWSCFVSQDFNAKTIFVMVMSHRGDRYFLLLLLTCADLKELRNSLNKLEEDIEGWKIEISGIEDYLTLDLGNTSLLYFRLA